MFNLLNYRLAKLNDLYNRTDDKPEPNRHQHRYTRLRRRRTQPRHRKEETMTNAKRIWRENRQDDFQHRRNQQKERLVQKNKFRDAQMADPSVVIRDERDNYTASICSPRPALNQCWTNTA